MNSPEAYGGAYIGIAGWLSCNFNPFTTQTFSDPYSAWSAHLHQGASQAQFDDPANTIYFCDSSSGYPSELWPPCWSADLGTPGAAVCDSYPEPYRPERWWYTMAPSMRHNGGFNAGWVDGHAKWCDIDTYYKCDDAVSCSYWDYD